MNFKIFSAHFCTFANKWGPKMAIFSTKKRRFIVLCTYQERSEPIRRTLWWSFWPICLLTLDEEKSCPYLHELKKSAFKNWKMLQFFKFFNKFEVFSLKNWRHNFFHKIVSFQNKMKNFINFILFCLTCILNTLYADYQNSNEQNILFPRFYTLMSIFWESFFLMENFSIYFYKKNLFLQLN